MKTPLLNIMKTTVGRVLVTKRIRVMGIPVLLMLMAAMAPGAAAESFEHTTAQGAKLTFEIDKARTDAVTLEGMSSFSGDLEIPSEVTSGDVTYTVVGIGQYACMSAAITSLTIPDTVTEIESGAFNYCTSLTSVTIPGSVSVVGDQAFGGCSALKSVVLEEGVTDIEYDAFSMCYDLESVTLPSTLVNIGDAAFYSDTSLKLIRCDAVTPPYCGEGAFMAVPKSCELLVPDESAETYRLTEPWSYFADTTTALNPATEPQTTGATAYYTLDGRRRGADVRGFAVKVEGGRAVKVLM